MNDRDQIHLREIRKRAESWVRKPDGTLQTRDSALGEEHLALDVLELLDEIEMLRGCQGEPHVCDQEAIAAAEGRTDRVIEQLAAMTAALGIANDRLRIAGCDEVVLHEEPER